jgi:hypothetical protein
MLRSARCDGQVSRAFNLKTCHSQPYFTYTVAHEQTPPELNIRTVISLQKLFFYPLVANESSHKTPRYTQRMKEAEKKCVMYNQRKATVEEQSSSALELKRSI